MSLPTVVSEARTHTTLHSLASTTEEIASRRRSRWRWVVPFAAALVVALGLIGLIAWQFGSDLGTSRPAPAAPATQTASNPPPAQTPTTPTAPPPVEEKKPSPMDAAPAATPPAETPETPKQTAPVQSDGQNAEKPAETPEAAPEQPKAEQPKPERPKVKPRPPIGPQDVMVTSEPASATATLDNDPSASCKTPCVLHVMPGRHTVSINQPGFQQESREVRIIDSPYEMPLVTLRARGGTIMVSSNPPGATIFLNDKPTDKVTPARLSVVPGAYNVRVEKDGVRKSESVEIKNGDIRFVPLDLH